MKKIAVIGGGIFGVTAAIHAARKGHDVDLFETLPDILQAASGINQYRLHRGYHYPRSSQTATSAAKAENSFRAEYGEAVVDEGKHIYAIAKEGSMVSAEQFLAFCNAHSLVYEEVMIPEIVDSRMVDIAVEVQESRFDPDLLRSSARGKLAETGVRLRVNTHATRDMLVAYDKVIIAAYSGNASVIRELAGLNLEHQYEICEKPVVTLPNSFGNTGVVIMDGPFMCVDPIGRSDRYVLGNVVHGIHVTNTGSAPVAPELLRSLLNRGLVEKPPVSKFDYFIESGTPFIPMLADAQHLGSFFTIRTVLPRLDATDARPTTVSALDDKHIQIFSGKIGNCVIAAQEAVNLL